MGERGRTMRQTLSWLSAVSLALLTPARRSTGIASPVMPDMLRKQNYISPNALESFLCPRPI